MKFERRVYARHSLEVIEAVRGRLLAIKAKHAGSAPPMLGEGAVRIDVAGVLEVIEAELRRRGAR